MICEKEIKLQQCVERMGPKSLYERVLDSKLMNVGETLIRFL